MGLTLGNGLSDKPGSMWNKAIDRAKAAGGKKEQAPATEARTAEDFGAVDVEDFESFDGSSLAAIRNAHSNQQTRAVGGEPEEEDGDEADVRLGEDGGADLAGSRKRKSGAAATSAQSPSIRI